mmetsp:Transcript_60075/g.169418  ORF Transcript_60075/g.169418 Transcript_60075/m.169418 type:complete len:279 (-) Transcript_60075:149-985(-)
MWASGAPPPARPCGIGGGKLGSLDTIQLKLHEDRKRYFVQAGALQVGSSLTTTMSKLDEDQRRTAAGVDFTVRACSGRARKKKSPPGECRAPGDHCRVGGLPAKAGRPDPQRADIGSLSPLMAKLDADKQRHRVHVAAVRMGVEGMFYALEDSRMEAATISHNSDSSPSDMPSERSIQDRFAIEVLDTLIDEAAHSNLCNFGKSLDTIRAQLDDDQRRHSDIVNTLQKKARQLEATSTVMYDCANSEDGDEPPYDFVDDLIFVAAAHGSGPELTAVRT